ncbi:F-box protein-like protein [Tanacetum coccineum]|uniref:F-box protein-like protein n=1 Tax=Tanacetum coccineum TaxID=301880 RepID=A0ABQ5EYP6_9ASTR
MSHVLKQHNRSGKIGQQSLEPMQTDASFRTVTTKERIEQIERLTFVPTIFVSFARIRIYLSFATVGISTFCLIFVDAQKFGLFRLFKGDLDSSAVTWGLQADVFAFAKIGGMDNKLKMVTGECLRAPKACEDSSSLHATMTIGTPKYTNVYVSPSARYVKGDLDDESFRLTAFMQLSALHYKHICLFPTPALRYISKFTTFITIWKRRASNMIDRWATHRSATVCISRKGFVARDIGFHNVAGPEKELTRQGIRAWIALLFLDDGNDDDIDVFGNEMDFYDAANSDEELL